MKDKILLIDAYSIICRGFYALPPLTYNGMHTNAVLGFLNILYKTIDDEKPKYIAVAFDENKKTFRHELYKEYKGNRKPMPIELKEQVPYVKDILDASCVKFFSKEGYEADDILGTLANKFASKDIEAVILSGDKDMLQLATENIKIRLVKTIKSDINIYEYYDKDVEKEYNITPTEFIDMKAIMGDPSDNIKGLPGIGKITANDLIIKYKSVENIYNHIDEINKKSIKSAFIEHFDEAIFYKKLVTIKKDVPIDCDLKDLEIKNLFNETAFSKISELGLKSQYKRFDKKVQKNVETSVLVENPFNEDEKISISLNKDENKKSEIIDFLNKEIIIVDNDDKIIELKNKIVEEKEKIAVFIYIDYVGSENRISSITFTDKTYVSIGVDYKKEIIETDAKVYLFDLKSSLKYFDTNSNIFEKFKIKNKEKFEDISIMSYVLNSNLASHTYSNLMKYYFGITLEAEKEYLKKNNLINYINEKNYKEDFIKYVTTKSKSAYILSDLLSKKIISEKLDKIYYEIDLPLSFVLYNMEKIGILVDKKELSKYDKDLDEKINNLTKEIYNLAGLEFNINSPKQLADVLFNKLNLTYEKKKGEKVSTSIEVLEKLRDKHEIIDKIIFYRTVSKLSTTYAKGMIEYIDTNNKIHTSFNQCETATGRLSSENPNLQNIPIKTELGKKFRKVFIPSPNTKFIDADYSQIELRVLAIMSKDKELINAYKTGEDVHTITASQVFSIDKSNVTDEMRRKAKVVNFGILYGMSSFTLGEDLKIDIKDAREYINRYFDKYKNVKEYLDNAVKNAEETGKTTTYYGRNRYIPEFKSNSPMIRAFAKRVAMNSPIQGTASDIIKIAMLNIESELDKNNLKSRMILQIHDEILIECVSGEDEKVREILNKCMKDSFTFDIPLAINIKVGSNFEEVH